MTMYHYHASLECGHKVGFDVDHDLLSTAIEQGAKDAQVNLLCAQCRKDRTSTEIMPAGQEIRFCVVCQKGFDS